MPGERDQAILAFIALGSNLGDSRRALSRAVEVLRGWSDEPLLVSSVWRSEPVDCPPGSADFLNAVVGLRPRRGETPETLLLKLQGVEREFGRERGLVRNAPRRLDLDLIAFGGEVRAGVDLILPHPRAHRRGFVLAPLAEIAPDMVLPLQERSVRRLWEELGGGEGLWRDGVVESDG